MYIFTQPLPNDQEYKTKSFLLVEYSRFEFRDSLFLDWLPYQG